MNVRLSQLTNTTLLALTANFCHTVTPRGVKILLNQKHGTKEYAPRQISTPPRIEHQEATRKAQ